MCTVYLKVILKSFSTQLIELIRSILYFFAGLGVIMCLKKSIKQKNGLNSPETQPFDVFSNLVCRQICKWDYPGG
jgi:hypothetical protein